MVECADPHYPGAPVAAAMTNRDFLPWFGEDERVECSACGERACVSLPEAKASFCLACSAITVDGRRIDRLI
jgi:hypothetical protein